ncbi:hypothetical protein M0813_14695 [Anaeramoeba flamelloides]|uniref:Uncharacterized protein n=1 Tax=Anaeramoeba flamelloides TaxID=1746091 RepID=A0ABQ8Z538_9EUKA|nr:hypothetical protein M0813_14695 [Anaeramoeba flamelloides]
MSDKSQLTLLAKKILGENEYQNLVGSSHVSSSEQEFSSSINQLQRLNPQMKTTFQTTLPQSYNPQHHLNYLPMRYDSVGEYSNYESQLLNTHLNQLLPLEYDSGEEPNGISNLQFLDTFKHTNVKPRKETHDYVSQSYLDQLHEKEKPRSSLKSQNKQSLLNDQTDTLSQLQKLRDKLYSPLQQYHRSNFKNDHDRARGNGNNNIKLTINNFIENQQQQQLQLQQQIYKQNLQSIESWKQIEQEYQNISHTNLMKQQMTTKNENFPYSNNTSHQDPDSIQNSPNTKKQGLGTSTSNNVRNNVNIKGEKEEIDLESEEALKIIQNFLVKPLNLKETTNRENPSIGVIFYLHLRNVIKTSQKNGKSTSKYILLENVDDSLIRKGQCTHEMAKFISKRLFFNPEFSKSGRKRGRKPRKQSSGMGKSKNNLNLQNKSKNKKTKGTNKIRKTNKANPLMAKSSATPTKTKKMPMSHGGKMYSNTLSKQRIQKKIANLDNNDDMN